MIWLTWRQFRVPALVTAVALAAVTIWLAMLGLDIRNSYNADLAACHQHCSGVAQDLQSLYGTQVLILGGLLIIAPGLIGIFWGAPLITRELEANTHKLVWNQSVTRRRWLGIKLAVLGLASMLAAGWFSLLLTWAAGPFDQVQGDRFDATVFAARNLAPVAYAAFAFALGTAIGLLVRRTVPAMALTLVLFTAVQLVMPNLVRPWLISPVNSTQQMTETAFEHLSFLGNNANIDGLVIPDAWVVSTSDLLATSGQRVDLNQYNNCVNGDINRTARCLAGLNLHVNASYQPANRYWAFQWLESAIFLAAAGLLAAFGLWRVRGRMA